MQTLLNLISFWAVIWTAPVDQMPQLFGNYVLGTFFLCLPLYCLLLAPGIFGIKSKFLGKCLQYLFVANVALAFAPVAVPAAVLYGLYRLVLAVRGGGQQQRPPQTRRRPAPAGFVDEEDEDE